MLLGFENERLAWLFKKRNLIKKIGTSLYLFSIQMALVVTDKLRIHLKLCKEEEREQFLSLPASPLPFSCWNGICTIRSQKTLTGQRGTGAPCSQTRGFGEAPSARAGWAPRSSLPASHVNTWALQRDTARQLWGSTPGSAENSRAQQEEDPGLLLTGSSAPTARGGVPNQLVTFTQPLTHQALPSAAPPPAKQGMCGFTV